MRTQKLLYSKKKIMISMKKIRIAVVGARPSC